MVSIILVQVVMQADNPFFSSHFPIFPLHFTTPSLHFMMVQLKREEDLLKRKKLQEEKIFMKKCIDTLPHDFRHPDLFNVKRKELLHYLSCLDE